MVSPIQMFDVNAINAGRQAGMQRGAVNSPYTPLGQALDKTLQKYDAHLAAQAEQQNKLGLLKAQYGLMGDNAIALQEAKNKLEAPPIPGMEGYDLEHPREVMVGKVPHFIQPIYKNGKIVGKKLQSTRAGTMWEAFDNSGGGDTTADDEASKALAEIEALTNQLPQGM